MEGARPPDEQAKPNKTRPGRIDWMRWIYGWGALVIMLGIGVYGTLYILALSRMNALMAQTDGNIDQAEFARLENRLALEGWVCVAAWLVFVIGGPIFVLLYGKYRNR